MIEYLRRLLGIREPEPCQVCEFLKQQLEYERNEKKELLETITSLLKPVPVINQPNELVKPFVPRLFSRRRAELERLDRENAKIKATSPVIAKPDSEIRNIKEEPKRQTVEQLEMELGVVDSDHVDNSDDTQKEAGNASR